LTIEQLAQLRNLEPRLQLVDVRNPREVAERIIPGAREIPLPALTDSLAGLDQTAPVVVYCASGYRSMVAASVLQATGFDDVSDVIGGFGAWEAAGLPSSHCDDSDTDGIPQVGPWAAKTMIDRGALLLDVREAAEWYIEHAPTAILLPVGRVSARLDELPCPATAGSRWCAGQVDGRRR
jgi:rhodanese-related sulfurtransferase